MPTGAGDGGEAKPRGNCLGNMEITMMKSMARTAWARRDNLTGEGNGWCRLVRMAAVGVMLVAAFSGTKSVAGEAVNINLDAGSINLFGFYNGMPKADAEALAAHYGLEADAYTFKEAPGTHEVCDMFFALDDIRRIVNVPDTVDTFEDFLRFLFRSPMFKISKPIKFKNLNPSGYSCTTSDGVEFKLNKVTGRCNLSDPERYIEAQKATLIDRPRMGIYSGGIANEIEENDYD
jgi:hypothetical protein